MNELAGLWIPIVISALAVFTVSSVGRVLVWHRLRNWKALPEEAATVEHLQKSGIAPGLYRFPETHPHNSAEAEESRLHRMNTGPWGTVNIRARQPSPGSALVQSLAFCLVTSVFVAYLATLALDPGDEFSEVFQVSGTAGLMAYAFGGVPNAIWLGQSFRSTVMDVVDGVILGLITGVVFAAFWHA